MIQVLKGSEILSIHETEEQAWKWIQKTTGQSASWMINHEGYALKEVLKMQIHAEANPMAGQKVTLVAVAAPMQDIQTGAEFHVEDYVDRVMGQSWKWNRGNPACLAYAVRAAQAKMPLDDECVYGKINGLGYILHMSEL